MRRNQLIIAALALVGLLLIVWLVLGMTRGNGDQDKLSDDQLNRSGSASAPDERCGEQDTYDRVKRELFRQAAATRGSDAPAFTSLAAYAAIRVDAPTLKRHDEELGTIVCSGRVAIDLPPGVAVVGGRRTLIADLDYAIQRAADGNGEVVTLSGAQGIIVPLATLARTGAQAEPADTTNTVGAADPLAPAPAPAAPPAVPATPAPAPAPAPVQSTARPSFDCGYARSRSEIAVCNDDGLAALDRQMASQYGRAFSSADPDQRVLLQQTRSRFLRYRDGCGNNGCIASAYRGRMREIGDIMAGRWVAPR